MCLITRVQLFLLSHRSPHPCHSLPYPPPPSNLSQGVEGVPSVVSSMEFYDLLRSDWDLISEIAQFPGKPDYTAQIPSKVYTLTHSTHILGKICVWDFPSCTIKACLKAKVSKVGRSALYTTCNSLMVCRYTTIITI